MSAARWVVGIGALVIAFAALYVLLRLGGDPEPREAMPELSKPPLDAIDERSRDAMRELIREDGEEG